MNETAARYVSDPGRSVYRYRGSERTRERKREQKNKKKALMKILDMRRFKGKEKKNIMQLASRGNTTSMHAGKQKKEKKETELYTKPYLVESWKKSPELPK